MLWLERAAMGPRDRLCLLTTSSLTLLLLRSGFPALSCNLPAAFRPKLAGALLAALATPFSKLFQQCLWKFDAATALGRHRVAMLPEARLRGK